MPSCLPQGGPAVSRAGQGSPVLDGGPAGDGGGLKKFADAIRGGDLWGRARPGPPGGVRTGG
ncbi:hypothetical protein AB0G81_38245, partial [Streptomyces asoensis]